MVRIRREHTDRPKHETTTREREWTRQNTQGSSWTPGRPDKVIDENSHRREYATCLDSEKKKSRATDAQENLCWGYERMERRVTFVRGRVGVRQDSRDVMRGGKENNSRTRRLDLHWNNRCRVPYLQGTEATDDKGCYRLLAASSDGPLSLCLRSYYKL